MPWRRAFRLPRRPRCRGRNLVAPRPPACSHILMMPSPPLTSPSPACTAPAGPGGRAPADRRGRVLAGRWGERREREPPLPAPIEDGSGLVDELLKQAQEDGLW